MTNCHLFFMCYYKVNNNAKEVKKVKDYYLLIGLNSKEIKILDVNQRGNGLIELDIENREQRYILIAHIVRKNV